MEFGEFLHQAVAAAGFPSSGLPLEAADQSILNGVPYRLFRQSTGLEERRQAGTFFSGPDIADKIARMLKGAIPEGAVAMDPTCGIGDLLLAYGALLPVKQSLAATLEHWGLQLAGMDLRPELVRMTKLRLVTLARTRGEFCDETVDVDGSFPLITIGDMLVEDDRVRSADGYLFNPPFGQTSDHAVDGWAAGRVNSAAIFLSHLAAVKHSAAPIAAVLPEVLRCGSRYRLFRQHISEAGLNGEHSSVGRFDRWTDVDVFLTLLEKGEKPDLWSTTAEGEAGTTVGDRFTVRVGPLVPHRHPKDGEWRPYLCAKTTPAWSVGFEAKNSRRFGGKVFKPPFVVVRRTSSPSDKRRAVGAVIIGDREVAVENHLIVLSPIDGGVDECRRLLSVLNAPETSDYLNESIRCRHLTTGSVSAIPWVD